MKCSNCGCEIEDGSKFCDVCGEKVETTQGTQLYTKELQQLEENEKENLLLDAGENNSLFQKLGKRNTIVLIVAAAAVLIAIIATIIAIVINSNDSDNVNDSRDFYTTTFDMDDQYNISTNEYTDEVESFNQENNDYNNSYEDDIYENNDSQYQQNNSYNTALDYIEQANAALKRGDREEAVSMAQKAKNVCTDSEILEQCEEIFLYQPFAMYTNSNVLRFELGKKNEMGGNPFDFNQSLKSNTNESYYHCLGFSNLGYYADSADAYYSLEGNYDTISGTIFLPQNFKDNYMPKAKFEIYGDGRKLYTSPNVTSGFRPEYFNVNISGVDILILRCYFQNGDYYYYAVSELCALKDLP